MRNKKILGYILFLTVILLLAVTINSSVKAQGNVSEAQISDKLNEILQHQKQILQEIGSMKKELDIIKLRVTRC